MLQQTNKVRPQLNPWNPNNFLSSGLSTNPVNWPPLFKQTLNDKGIELTSLIVPFVLIEFALSNLADAIIGSIDLNQCNDTTYKQSNLRLVTVNNKTKEL